MTDLDARYGRSPRARRRTRVVGVVVGALVAATVVAWVCWAGVLSPAADIGVDAIGYHVDSDSLTTVSYQVTIEGGGAAGCAVQAEDSSGATVGWRVVAVPAGDTVTRQFSTEVRTVRRAVTGLIYSCWRA
ncbi:MAG: DUF4307 domain-containing protein [Microbacteriaceae bacterium]